MSGGFRIALIQAAVVGGDRETNAARALELIGRAAVEGAELALLPEALPLGWTDPAAANLADAIPDGAWCGALREAARRHGIFVCAGVVERAGDRVFNAAVLIDPSGVVVLHHRKINELDIGHAHYALGDRLAVADTALGRVGLMICADAFAADRVITRTLGLMGAQIVLSPSAWAVPADHDHEREPYGALWENAYVPVAREHRMWIAGVSSVGWIPNGPWAGRRCIGRSLLVAPDGEIVVTGPYGEDAEALLTADVELADRDRPWHHPPDRWFRPLEEPPPTG